MTNQNKVLVNIEQNLTSEEKATARKNIGVYNPNDGRLRLLSDEGAVFGDFMADQADNKDITISRDMLDVYSKSEVDNKIPGKMTLVYLGGNISTAGPIMDNQSSATVLSVLGNIQNPIQLDAGKTYLIQPSVVGTSDYTLARSESGTTRFSLELLLVQDDEDLSFSIPIARSQFYLRSANGSNQAGYRFIVPIASQAYLYTPTTDITFTKLVLSNNGNILGGDGSTRCWMDFVLGSLIITKM